MGIFSGSMIRRREVVDPLLEGLVEWWWLDSANGRFGAKGAFDLTENGTLTKNASGGPGGGGYTSGTSSADTNFYSLAHDAAFGLTEYSVSFWAAIPSTLPSTNQFFRTWTKGTNAFDANSPYGDMQTNSGTSPTQVITRHKIDQGSVAATGTSSGDPRGVWIHVVAQRTSSRKRVWMNGSMTYDVALGTAASNTDNLRIMSINTGGNNPNMALFGWWDRELVSAEISRLYGSGTPLTPADIGL